MPKPMICPYCDLTMNHHAEKLVDPRDAREAAAMDAPLGGLIDEVHTCPGCGREATRRGA